jgi:hypothetical protein
VRGHCCLASGHRAAHWLVHSQNNASSLKRQLLCGLQRWVQRPLDTLRSVFYHIGIRRLFKIYSGRKKTVSAMTVKATKFTPEVLLSAPRRSPAVPSPNGKKALFTVSGTGGQGNGYSVDTCLTSSRCQHTPLRPTKPQFSFASWISSLASPLCSTRTIGSVSRYGWMTMNSSSLGVPMGAPPSLPTTSPRRVILCGSPPFHIPNGYLCALADLWR